MSGTQPVGSTKALANLRDTFEAIRPGTSQSLSFNGVSAQSNAVGIHTSIVRLFATQDCFIRVGENPTAVGGTSMFVPAGIIDFIGVLPGDKIAAIRSVSDGVLYITEGA